MTYESPKDKDDADDDESLDGREPLRLGSVARYAEQQVTGNR